MIFLKRFTVAFMGLAFLLALAVTTSYAQEGRYWRGDNGRHVGSYRSDRGRRGRYVRHGYVPRYFTTYYPRVYPRYVQYRTYPRYYTNYSPEYYTYYPRYGTYRRYPRSRVAVSLNFGW